MNGIREGLNRVYKVLAQVLNMISAVFMALLILIVLYSVFSRYILNSSIAWAEEVSRFLFIFVICIGAVTAYFRNEHLGLDLLVKILPRSIHKQIDFIKNSLMLFITGFMTYGGWRLMMASMDSRSPALRIRMGYIYSILPVFAALLFVTTAVRLVCLMAGFFSSKEV